jgi:hypothetical protein
LNDRHDLSSLGDRDLVDGIEHCHFDAMAEIYERHSGHVHALAVQIWGTRRADHVVQDVFVQLWQLPTSFDPDHGSLSVHLSMQVRLWLAPSTDVEVERRSRERLSQDRRIRTGLAALHGRVTDRAFSRSTRQQPRGDIQP